MREKRAVARSKMTGIRKVVVRELFVSRREEHQGSTPQLFSARSWARFCSDLYLFCTA
jgi:hypothetical protein